MPIHVVQKLKLIYLTKSHTYCCAIYLDAILSWELLHLQIFYGIRKLAYLSNLTADVSLVQDVTSFMSSPAQLFNSIESCGEGLQLMHRVCEKAKVLSKESDAVWWVIVVHQGVLLLIFFPISAKTCYIQCIT